jgi:hypothetical protein
MMQTAAPREDSRTERVHEICGQIRALVALSIEQRRTIDRLLGELERIVGSAARDVVFSGSGTEALSPIQAPTGPSRQA